MKRIIGAILLILLVACIERQDRPANAISVQCTITQTTDTGNTRLVGKITRHVYRFDYVCPSSGSYEGLSAP